MVLALAITILTNVLLKVTPFMMVVSVATIILLTLAIGAMALGFGALYPQFETENAAQIPTSYGGLVFMMSTIALLAAVIVIEAVPVSGYLRAALNSEPVSIDLEMLAAFAAVTLICFLATLIPLRVGLRKMEQFEF